MWVIFAVERVFFSQKEFFVAKTEKTTLIKYRRLMKRILFAIPDGSEPFTAGDECNEGAILRLLRERSFDRIVLLGLPGYRLSVTLTEREFAVRFPKKVVQSYALGIPSLSYKEVFNGLKKVLEVETSDLQAKDRLTFLLPSAAEDPILDCLLLLSLSLPQKVEVCQAEPPAEAWVQQTFQTEEDAFEWHDAATDKDKDKTFLSAKQLDFLYHAWNQNKAFCLKTRDAAQEKAVSRAMHLYSSTSGSPYRDVDCADIPENVSNELLWGYRAETDGKTFVRDGLLTKQDANLSLSRWDALSEVLKSNITAFLSKSDRHFMAVSTTEDEFLQIPTFALPN